MNTNKAPVIFPNALPPLTLRVVIDQTLYTPIFGDADPNYDLKTLQGMLQRVLRTLWWHNFSYSASGAAAGDSVGNVAKVTAGDGDRPTDRASGLGPTADNDDAVAQCGAVVPRTGRNKREGTEGGRK